MKLLKVDECIIYLFVKEINKLKFNILQGNHLKSIENILILMRQFTLRSYAFYLRENSYFDYFKYLRKPSIAACSFILISFYINVQSDKGKKKKRMNMGTSHTFKLQILPKNGNVYYTGNYIFCQIALQK